jgi:carbamoyl-phosphate synthase large subunit
MEIGILVTGVGNITTGEQIYRAMLLGRRRYRITIANVDQQRMIVANGARKVVLPAADHPEYVAALAAAANEAAADFILPGSDRELIRIAAERDQLARGTRAIPLINNEAVIRTCSDKQATARAIQECGFAVPATVDATSVEAAVEAVASGRLTLPVVIKPKYSSGGSANVYIAQDEAELRFFVHYAMQCEPALVLQEYVGDAEHEYSVSVIHYPDGSLGGSMATRRHLTSRLSTHLKTPNRTGRAELGAWLVISTAHSQGEIDDFADVRQAAERVATQMGSTGPLNVQGRLTGSKFYVFEINPRFSGSTAVRARAGHNGPEALIDWHLGVESELGKHGPRRATFLRGLTDYVDVG